jgi:ribosomal protein S4
VQLASLANIEFFLNLKKVRQTWNKFNLYNLARVTPSVKARERTFFQQKWVAKSVTRGYHGEHIKEKAWQRMFSRKLQSVVEMPPQYLATYDGSEQAAGRGSGKEPSPEESRHRLSAESFSHFKPPRSSFRPPFPHPRQNAYRRGDRSAELLAKPVKKITPYMQMSFAPQERRLDVAIFRALFASSARQARQFCVHGAVKVNGIKVWDWNEYYGD